MYTVEFKDVSGKPVCFLPISVGQGYHEGERFEATIDAVNKSFSRIIIIIGDALQRHTLQMSRPLENDVAKTEALEMGKKWLESVAKILSKLTIPCDIVHWENFMTEEQFQGYESLFNEKYGDIENFIDFASVLFTASHAKKLKQKEEKLRHKQKNKSDTSITSTDDMPITNFIDAKQAQKHSRDYIIEELKKFIHLNTMGPIHFVYPYKGNDVAENVIAALKILLGKETQVIFTNIRIDEMPSNKKSARANDAISSNINIDTKRSKEGSKEERVVVEDKKSLSKQLTHSSNNKLGMFNNASIKTDRSRSPSPPPSPSPSPSPTHDMSNASSLDITPPGSPPADSAMRQAGQAAVNMFLNNVTNKLLETTKPVSEVTMNNLLTFTQLFVYKNMPPMPEKTIYTASEPITIDAIQMQTDSSPNNSMVVKPSGL